MAYRKCSTSLGLFALSLFATIPAHAQTASPQPASPQPRTNRPNTGPSQTRPAPTRGTPSDTSGAQASDVEAPTEGGSKTVETSSNPTSITQSDFSSGAIRARRPFALSGQYTPLSDFVLQAGGAAGLNVGRYFQFGASLLMGSKDLKSEVGSQDDARLDELTVSGFATEAYARLYPMKGTFSFRLGVGYRQADMKYRIASKSSPIFVEGNLKVSSLVMPVFVGNHWSFDNGIFFGCDWVGLYVPLTGSTKSSTKSNIDEKSVKEIQADLQDLGDDLAKRTSVTVALISFGYQF